MFFIVYETRGCMGRRKGIKIKLRKPPKKKIPKRFNCLLCFKDNSVSVCFNKEKATGSLFCNSCHIKKEYKTTPLCEEIDIYTQWLDQKR